MLYRIPWRMTRAEADGRPNLFLLSPLWTHDQLSWLQRDLSTGQTLCSSH